MLAENSRGKQSHQKDLLRRDRVPPKSDAGTPFVPRQVASSVGYRDDRSCVTTLQALVVQAHGANHPLLKASDENAAQTRAMARCVGLAYLDQALVSDLDQH